VPRSSIGGINSALILGRGTAVYTMAQLAHARLRERCIRPLSPERLPTCDRSEPGTAVLERYWREATLTDWRCSSTKYVIPEYCISCQVCSPQCTSTVESGFHLFSAELS
jgi:hypothetical protein